MQTETRTVNSPAQVGEWIKLSHGRCCGEPAQVTRADERTFSATCSRCGWRMNGQQSGGYLKIPTPSAFDAQTLIKQLGTALPMLGARNLVASENGLQFSIASGARCGANKLVITLADDDTYTVDAWKVRGHNFAQVGHVEMVYADGLHRVLEDLTGMAVRL